MSTPKDWSSALIAAGFTDRRSKDDAPSWRALADAVGVHPSTLTAMRDGLRETDQATVDRVAQALGVDVLTVSEWVGRARTERNPYRAPDEANLLDQDERAAVDKLIHLLARSKRGGNSDGRQPDAEKMTDPEPPGPRSLREFKNRRLSDDGLPEELKAADDRGKTVDQDDDNP